MSKSIDTQMSEFANMMVHITGKYYGVRFAGVVVSSRQNQVNFREMITIRLDAPILCPGGYMDGSPIMLVASMVESGVHSIDQLEGAK